MRIVFQIGALLLTTLIFSAFTPTTESKESIKWYTWEEAIELNEKTQKKIFIDVYTDWCGWCKRMDQSTFKDPEVVKYMNENFYAVKFDAEQKKEITYKGHTMKYVAQGRRGYHELAYSLLDGRMGYPAFVYLAEDEKRITVSPGYKDADTIMKELVFISEDHIKSTSYDDFVKNYKSKKP